MRDRPRVLVVDDEESIRGFVGAVLSRAGYEPKMAHDGESALDMAEADQPDAVILDLRMPGKSGLDICSELRRWYRGPILVLSGLGDEATIVAALDHGADDYLTKPFRSEEFLARLRALMRRVTHDASQATVIEVGDLKIDLRTREVETNGEPIHLTRTEFDILAHLAANRDRVVTSESLLKAVWGPHHGEYAQTLRVHVGHIRKKIEPNPSEPKYVLTALGVGYRLYQPD